MFLWLVLPYLSTFYQCTYQRHLRYLCFYVSLHVLTYVPIFFLTLYECTFLCHLSTYASTTFICSYVPNYVLLLSLFSLKSHQHPFNLLRLFLTIKSVCLFSCFGTICVSHLSFHTLVRHSSLCLFRTPQDVDFRRSKNDFTTSSATTTTTTRRRRGSRRWCSASALERLERRFRWCNVSPNNVLPDDFLPNDISSNGIFLNTVSTVINLLNGLRS